MPLDMSGETNPRGIFIPYEKLLEQISDKLDRVIDQLAHINKSKLDVAVFESFRTSYEQRHENLREATDGLKQELADRPQQVKEFRQLQADVEQIQFWRNRLVGALGLVALGTPCATGLVVWLITK